MIFNTLEEVKAYYEEDPYFSHEAIKRYKTTFFDKVYHNKYFIVYESSSADSDLFNYNIVAIENIFNLRNKIITIGTVNTFEEAENKINELLIQEIIA